MDWFTIWNNKTISSTNTGTQPFNKIIPCKFNQPPRSSLLPIAPSSKWPSWIATSAVVNRLKCLLNQRRGNFNCCLFFNFLDILSALLGSFWDFEGFAASKFAHILTIQLVSYIFVFLHDTAKRFWWPSPIHSWMLIGFFSLNLLFIFLVCALNCLLKALLSSKVIFSFCHVLTIVIVKSVDAFVW